MKQLLAIFCLIPVLLQAQSLSSIEDKTKNLKPYKGHLNFYWDENTGKIFLEINKFDTELLYQTSLPAGLGSNDVGLDRGILGNTAIIKFNKVGNKVLMIQPNYRYRAVTNDAAERKAVEQSFAQSVLWGFTIEAQSNEAVLVDATPFLLRDVAQAANRLQVTRQGTYTVDLSRSAIYLERTKNFPMNTEFEATITLTTKDARPGNFVNSVTPSADAVTLRMHHSFIQLPDDKFEVRENDPRSGCLDISFFDFSTPVTEPIEKFYIIRHRLQKKDPSAAMSETVKPIIYYLDNGTPEPIRSALLEGGRWWNQAFEAAGYKDAFQVKVLPDTADPMDIRYNMISWVHRSTRGWSYGDAVVDPRTGEILKGNVTLGSLRVRQDYLIATGLLSPFKEGIGGDDRMLTMALQRLKQLSAHEIGHTIGFRHNYISSTQGKASVMDYPAPEAFINSKGEIDLSNAYTNEIGDWDKVSVAYAYQDFPSGTNEKKALEKILLNAASKGLTFISDRDARDTAGINPSSHLWDNGKDAVEALRQTMNIRSKALQHFGENSIRKGTPFSMLEETLVPIYLYHRYQLEAVTKIIGGMNYSYAVKGDGQLITKEIPEQDQIKALNAVMDCMEPSFLFIPQNIVSLIPPKPAMYNYSREQFTKRTGPAFDAVSAAETAAELPLRFLFHPTRLNRLVQNQTIEKSFGIDDMINIIMNRTWKAKRLNGTSLLIQLQNEQLVLNYLMRVLNSDDASVATKSAMQYWINHVKQYATQQLKTANNSTNAGHYMMALDRIEKKSEMKPLTVTALPPGAPIGCDE